MTKLKALNKLILKITGEEYKGTTIEGAISFLSQKLVGNDPNTIAIADAINYLATNYSGDEGEQLADDEAIIKYNIVPYGSQAGLINCITEIKNLNVSEFTNMQSLFESWHYLEKVTFKKLPSQPISYENMFYNCLSLEDISDLDTSKATSLSNTFASCSNLKYVPVLDVSSLNAFNSLARTFRLCPLLTETSLNNILLMCANAPSVVLFYGSLRELGLTKAQATTCTELSNYQSFLDAGWTTGY